MNKSGDDTLAESRSGARRYQARGVSQFFGTPTTSPRARYISPYLKISFDFTRPAAGRTRPSPAAPLAVAFVPGQHRTAYVDSRPATRITFTAAPTLVTRF